jgi:ribonuclease R
MLPEVLSNFACSLRPNEENILFSYFEITDKCEVVDQWFGRTVIYSDQRFAYEEYIIETKDNTMPEEISISGNSYVVSDEIVDATLK